MRSATLGGGIWAYAFDTVKLVNVAVRGNSAQFGGGIRDQTPKVVLKKTTVAQNIATEGGGIHLPIGLFDPSVLQITSSTIQGNLATKGGGILADGYSIGRRRRRARRPSHQLHRRRQPRPSTRPPACSPTTGHS